MPSAEEPAPVVSRLLQKGPQAPYQRRQFLLPTDVQPAPIAPRRNAFPPVGGPLTARCGTLVTNGPKSAHAWPKPDPRTCQGHEQERRDHHGALEARSRAPSRGRARARLATRETELRRWPRTPRCKRAYQTRHGDSQGGKWMHEADEGGRRAAAQCRGLQGNPTSPAVQPVEPTYELTGSEKSTCIPGSCARFVPER